MWENDGLTARRARLAALEQLRAEYSANMRTGAWGCESCRRKAPVACVLLVPSAY